jgi:hypothetical protein
LPSRAPHTLRAPARNAPLRAQALEGNTKIDDELEKLRASLPSARKKPEIGAGDS